MLLVQEMMRMQIVVERCFPGSKIFAINKPIVSATNVCKRKPHNRFQSDSSDRFEITYLAMPVSKSENTNGAIIILTSRRKNIAQHRNIFSKRFDVFRSRISAAIPGTESYPENQSNDDLSCEGNFSVHKYYIAELLNCF